MAVSSTVIIVIVAVAVAFFALLLVSYIFWSRSKKKVPLPPVQPLAHDRERSLHALAMEKEQERSMFLQIQIASSWSEPGTMKSSVSSESGSTVNTGMCPPVPPGISSANRRAPPRPLSLASSAHTSRSNLSRAIPHAPDSNVQIVLPAPLGASSVNYSRNSVADGWASQVINNSQPLRSRSNSRPQSLPKTHSRSSSTQTYHHSRPKPSPPNSFAQNRTRTNSLPYAIPSPHQVPPVPTIPSLYGQPNFASPFASSSYSDSSNAETEPRRRGRTRGPPHSRSFHTLIQEVPASQFDMQPGRAM